MPSTMRCEIVSAEREMFSGKVTMVVATGAVGDLGILPHHTPLLTSLQPGPVRVQLDDGTEELFYVNGGYLEVQPKEVTILADVAERVEEMDEQAAEAARVAAREALEGKNKDMDYSAAAAQLAESLAQLRTIEHLRRKGGRGGK